MVFNKAINTNTYCPCAAAAENTKNLLKNPANGGIPANENRASIITKLNRGLV